MVVENPETPVNTRICYPIVTIPLYKCGFLGLNMIKPHKPLIDSGLAVFLFAVSNKTAPKVKKNAPISRGGQNKLFYHPSHDVVAKVGIFFETTKKAARWRLPH